MQSVELVEVRFMTHPELKAQQTGGIQFRLTVMLLLTISVKATAHAEFLVIPFAEILVVPYEFPMQVI